MTDRTLAFRAGTHASFSAAMRAALDAAPALAELRARDTSDPAIALIDAWAMALDVLAFYSERIAVEGFLATATEPGSVRELAATVGYRPAPGLAASGLLAFTLEDGVGAPTAVTLDAGLKVQSVPGPGALPQTYETDTAIEARPVWNALAPRMWADAGPGPTDLFLPGVVTDLRAGDALLFTGETRERTGAGPDWALRVADTVTPQPDGTTTGVSWLPALPPELGADIRVYALRQRAAVFGHNAPDWRSMPDSIRLAYQDPAFLARFVRTLPIRDGAGLGDEWPRFTVAAPGAPSSVDLDAVYPSIVEGGWAVVSAPGVQALYRVDSVTTTGRNDFTLSSKVTRLALRGADLAKLVGAQVRTTVVLADSQRLALAPRPVSEPVQGRQIQLASPVESLPAGRAVIATGRRAMIAVADDVFDLTLRPADGSPAVPVNPGEVLIVIGGSTDAGPDGSVAWPVRRADGTTGTVIGIAAQLPAVPAPDGDPVVSEAAVTADPAGDDVLHLVGALTNAYDRTSVRFAGNVASASHGEARTELLGSGDASTPLQSFILAVPPDPVTGRAPLTYVQSAVPGGSTSSLSVVVDGLRWQEVRSLVGAGPRDRVYTVGLTAAGRIRVAFGDGVTGARLPTGVGNVTATYRVGTGLAGAMPAGRISLLLTRPLGVRSVTNPLPTGLAEDPETDTATRVAAPRTALTLDRVVSLTDYTEAARAFAGIGKAAAVWAWEGQTRVVRITAAGAGGLPVDDQTRRALVASLTATGDPFQRIRVVDFTPIPVDITALLVSAPGYQTDPVRAAVLVAVHEAFSFDRRDFGQPITDADVAAVIQAVDGVAGVATLTLSAGGDPGVGGAELATVRGLVVTVQGAT
jgi:hypothetical protein